MTTTTKAPPVCPLRLRRPTPPALALVLGAAFAACLATAAPAAAQLPDGRSGPCPAAPLISTAGAGTVTVPADGATVHVRVEATGPSPSGASAAMTERIEAVIAALDDAGADARATTGYSLDTVDHHETFEVIGYRAVSGVVLTVSDLSRLSSFLEAALSGGATSISGLHFTSQRKRETHDRALTAAYEQAARDAEVLAAAAGRRLGPLAELTTLPQPMSTFFQEEIVVSGTVPELESPRVEVEARVHGRWCLGPPAARPGG